MHGLQACEIPLLWCAGSTVWPTASAVRAMRTHVDDSPEEARSADSSDANVGPAPSVRGRLHARPAVLQASGRGVAGVSVSLPPGAAPVCRPPQPAEDSSWTARAPGRWSVVRVRRNAVGPVLDGAQALPRQLRHLPRSPAVCGEGGRFALAEGLGRHRAAGRAAHSSHGRRQPPRNAAARPGAPVGAATVPFPLAPEAAGTAKRSTSSSAAPWSCPRDNAYPGP
jgi:hypothetical protein